MPEEEVPPELPEPVLGINFARDGMQRKDWLALVAVHSDAWLMAVAFYYGAKLDKEGRLKLFKNINTMPTVYESVTGKVKVPNGSKSAKKRKAESVSYERTRTYERMRNKTTSGCACPSLMLTRTNERSDDPFRRRRRRRKRPRLPSNHSAQEDS